MEVILVLMIILHIWLIPYTFQRGYDEGWEEGYSFQREEPEEKDIVE